MPRAWGREYTQRGRGYIYRVCVFNMDGCDMTLVWHWVILMRSVSCTIRRFIIWSEFVEFLISVTSGVDSAMIRCCVGQTATTFVDSAGPISGCSCSPTTVPMPSSFLVRMVSISRTISQYSCSSFRLSSVMPGTRRGL